MTANTTGRTVSKWLTFVLDDVGGTLRSIPINSINGLGLEFPAKDITAWQDAVHGSLPETPSCTIEIEGPLTIDALQTVAAGISGSHLTLAPIQAAGGVQTSGVPLTIDVRCGMRHAWEADEPQFGITGSASNGFWLSSYVPDWNNSTYKATFEVYAGSDAPAWGTAAES